MKPGKYATKQEIEEYNYALKLIYEQKDKHDNLIDMAAAAARSNRLKMHRLRLEICKLERIEGHLEQVIHEEQEASTQSFKDKLNALAQAQDKAIHI